MLETPVGPNHKHPSDEEGHVMAEIHVIACAHCGTTVKPTGRDGKYRKSQKYCGLVCSGLAQPRRHVPIEVRFKKWVRIEPNGCWRWTGSLNGHGYGRIRDRGGSGKLHSSHEYAYVQKNGPVPAGLELDHLCRNRWCCNPDHLEAVTHRTNVIRGDAPTAKLHRSGMCARGHTVCSENTQFHTRGPKKGRVIYCRACRKEDRKKNRESREKTN